MKVAVLGHEGMLGHIVLRVLKKKFKTMTFSREELDAETISQAELTKLLKSADWVVNCIGKIKPTIDENDPESVLRAIRVNSIFPHFLAGTGKRVIQIATDCVYSGKSDSLLTEYEPHDPLDVYGKTKSLGEVNAPNFANIRCSIIGPEKKTKRSLYEWILSQHEANGYVNHLWNGVTTLAFAKVCSAMIKSNIIVNQHLVPRTAISKCHLLEAIADTHYWKIKINPVNAEESIYRKLDTVHSTRNKSLWLNAGYQGVPTIEFLLEELYNYLRSGK